jgi:tRNA modification GTPase
MTPPGRGAVATICLRGDLAILDSDESLPAAWRPARGGLSADLALNDVVFGRWGEANPEDVVVCRVAEDVAEIHCHGGRAAVGRILADLESRGCRVTTWAEQVEMMPALEAECNQALTQATTMRTAVHLLAQQGALAGRLKELLSLDADELRSELDELLRWSEFGLHLTTPWSVVLCGRPNVGKSSLINALVGYRRAIVFDEPGTTRDVVQADTALDGWPIRFADTAGLREGAESLEQLGIEKTREQMLAADLLIIVLDGTQPIAPEDLQLLEQHPRDLVVVSKADLPTHEEAERFLSSRPDAVHVSAVAGTGIERLQQLIVPRLVPEAPAVGTPFPFTQRQVDCLRAARQAESATEARAWVVACPEGGLPGGPC